MPLMNLSNKSQDYIFILLLILIPTLIFRSIFSTNFLNFWDFIVPSTWMNHSDLNLEALLKGDVISSLPIVSGRQTLASILDTIFGNYSLHTMAIAADPLMGLSVYIFARYFKVNPIYSFLVGLFSIFNPYTFIQSADSLFDLYRVVAFLPFILSYFILRVRKNIYFIIPSAFFILFPSVYGANFFLFIGGMFCFEISYFLSVRKEFFKGFYTIVIILIVFLVGHLNDLEKYFRLSTIVQNYSSYSAAHFTLFQILTFQNLFYWENSYVILMTPSVAIIIQIIFLTMLLVGLFWIVLYLINDHKRLKDTDMKLLSIFSIVFIFYSILFTSSGSNYLGFNGIISYFLPFEKGIDPWDYGAFLMYSFIIIFIIFFRLNFSLNSNIIKVLNFHKKDYKYNMKKIFTLIMVILLLTSVIPYFYLTTNLGNTIEPNKISNSQECVYKYLEDHNSGYFITSPMTYGLSFNGSNNILQGINNHISRSGVDFFYQYPPTKDAMYSSLFNNLSSFFYSGGLEGKIAFDSLSTLMGIHYLINFDNKSLACYWPSNDYPVSDQYIENNTNFKLEIENKTVSLFVNPNYRGTTYTSNKVIISGNPVKAIMNESKIGLSIPVVSERSLQYLINSKIDLYTFNKTIKTEYPNLITLLKPISYSVVRDASNLNYNGTYHNINSIPALNKVFFNLNGITNSSIYSFSNTTPYVLIQGTLASPVIKFNNTEFQDFVNSSTNICTEFSFQIRNNSEFSVLSNFNDNGTIKFDLNNGNEYMKITALYGGELTYINLNYPSKSYRYHYYETIDNSSLIGQNAKIKFIFINKTLIAEINKQVIFSSLIPTLGSNINISLHKKEASVERLNLSSLIQSNLTKSVLIPKDTIGLLEVVPHNDFKPIILLSVDANISSVNSLKTQTCFPVSSRYYSTNASIDINTSKLRANQIFVINTYQQFGSNKESVILNKTCNTFYVVILKVQSSKVVFNVENQKINYLYLLYICIEVITFVSTIIIIFKKNAVQSYHKLWRHRID